jgi:carbon dioxide concentrating mechanism protein CcmN
VKLLPATDGAMGLARWRVSPSANSPCVEGDVTIDATATIAPNVILRADAGYSITIEAGVSIAFGCVIRATEGNVVIAAAAVLGTEVLVVGSVTIGTRACIGTATTVWNRNIAAGEILPANTLVDRFSDVPNVAIVGRSPDDRDSNGSSIEEKIIVDEERQELTVASGDLDREESGTIVDDVLSSNSDNSTSEKEDRNREVVGESEASLEAEITDSEKKDLSIESQAESNDRHLNEEMTVTIEQTHTVIKTNFQDRAEVETKSVNLASPIYGKASLERLLNTLMPHRQSLNDNTTTSRIDPSSIPLEDD